MISRIKPLLLDPVVDLWGTLTRVPYTGWLLISLKLCVFFGFLYLWSYWTFMMLAFSDDTYNTFTDYVSPYIFMLPVHIGLLISIIPLPKFFKWIAFLPILFTSFLYCSVFFAQSPAYKFAIIGLVVNISAVTLLVESIQGN